MITVSAPDGLDLKKIFDSGQCFRWQCIGEDAWRIPSSGKVLEVRQTAPDTAAFFCSEEEFEGFWKKYFDLGTDYDRISEMIDPEDCFLSEAAAAGRGIRILSQDPWETLVTFIISQRKNMPAIAQAVEKLSRQYGHMLQEGIYSFPHPQELGRASEQDLRALGLGYRAPYVKDAVEKVLSGQLVFADMEKLDDDSLYQKLLEVKGVGKKVADCVCLFGFGRTSRAPVDIWIGRAIDCCGGTSPFPVFGPYAGIVQQYVFYSMTKCG